DAAELMGICLAAEHLWQVLAGHHDLGTGDQRSEEPVKFLDVHRIAARASREEFPEVVEFRVRQGVVGKDHRRLRSLDGTISRRHPLANFAEHFLWGRPSGWTRGGNQAFRPSYEGRT